MKPHKWQKEIIAWANGAVIQYKNDSTDGRWTYFMVGPSWVEGTEYRASIAEVEGKPVFIGDELYAADGHKFIVNEMCSADKWGLNEGCSWNPPKPKTITVNGAALPAPDGNSGHCFLIIGNCSNTFHYKNQEDRNKVEAAFLRVMEGC